MCSLLAYAFGFLFRGADMENKFDSTKYRNQFDKENYKRVTVLVPNVNTQMLNWLDKNKPVSSYILNLIDQDMKKHM